MWSLFGFRSSMINSARFTQFRESNMKLWGGGCGERERERERRERERERERENT